MSFRRGELYNGIVERQQTAGSEQFSDPAFPRPYLIVSDDRVQTLGIVVAVPLTSKTDKYAVQNAIADFRVLLTPQMVKYLPLKPGVKVTPRPSLVLGEQIRVMAVERLGDKVGDLTAAGMAEVDAALSLLLRLG